MRKLSYITGDDSVQTVEGVKIFFWKVKSISLDKNKVTIKSAKGVTDIINFPTIEEASSCHKELTDFFKLFQN